jgi:hypothetical protein
MEQPSELRIKLRKEPKKSRKYSDDYLSEAELEDDQSEEIYVKRSKIKDNCKKNLSSNQTNTDNEIEETSDKVVNIDPDIIQISSCDLIEEGYNWGVLELNYGQTENSLLLPITSEDSASNNFENIFSDKEQEWLNECSIFEGQYLSGAQND